MKTIWLMLFALATALLSSAEPGQSPASVNELDRAALTGTPEPDDAPTHQPNQYSLSASKQFHVFGGNGAQRAALVRMADEIRQQFYRLLKAKPGEDPQVPIHLILHGKVGDPPQERPIAFQLLETSENYLLRMHLDLSRGIDRARLNAGLRSALLYALGLDGVTLGSLQTSLRAPWWLVIGLQEADAWQRGEADRKLYAGVFKQGAEYSMDELFALREGEFWQLEGLSRALFRVHAGALVMALLEQPDGHRSFRQMSAEITRYDGETPILLRQHFPELNLSEHSLRKWWALTLAKLSDAPLTEVMSIMETEQALVQALSLRMRDEADQSRQVLSFDDLVRRDELQAPSARDRFTIIRSVQDRLSRLSYRCFPSYRPLLLDYQKILVQWARNGTDPSLEKQLAELAATRQRMHDLALRARDYLDYTEISQANELSGSFDDFIDLKNTLEPTRNPTRYDDPISNYLDPFERAYQK